MFEGAGNPKLVTIIRFANDFSGRDISNRAFRLSCDGSFIGQPAAAGLL